jgi:hypothetical protein
MGALLAVVTVATALIMYLVSNGCAFAILIVTTPNPLLDGVMTDPLLLPVNTEAEEAVSVM